MVSALFGRVLPKACEVRLLNPTGGFGEVSGVGLGFRIIEWF